MMSGELFKTSHSMKQPNIANAFANEVANYETMTNEDPDEVIKEIDTDFGPLEGRSPPADDTDCFRHVGNTNSWQPISRESATHQRIFDFNLCRIHCALTVGCRRLLPSANLLSQNVSFITMKGSNSKKLTATVIVRFTILNVRSQS
jgi:hypothetical protein